MNETSKEEAFVFYRSFYEAMEGMADGDRLALFEAVARYGLYGETGTLPREAKRLFTLILPQLEANRRKRASGRQSPRAKAAGKKATGLEKADSDGLEKGDSRGLEKKSTGGSKKSDTTGSEKSGTTGSENASTTGSAKLNTTGSEKSGTTGSNFSEPKEKEKEKETETETGKEPVYVAPAAVPPAAPSATHTQRPTREEVIAYCRERGNSLDPHYFFDYYESNGWRVGQNPMRNWRATVRAWEHGERGAPGCPAVPAGQRAGLAQAQGSYLDNFREAMDILRAKEAKKA